MRMGRVGHGAHRESREHERDHGADEDADKMLNRFAF